MNYYYKSWGECMAKKNGLSMYMSFLLRHHPESIGLDMDEHGWVFVDQLIKGINDGGKYTLDLERLERIVAEDSKGRYRLSEDKAKIKACQGHSISWVKPELKFDKPPEYLYHGTTTEALDKIMESGAIMKMSRHAVHMQADMEKAWQSALRWRKKPVVLKIAAQKLYEAGGVFGETDNHVWCIENVPVKYIEEQIYYQN